MTYSPFVYGLLPVCKRLKFETVGTSAHVYPACLMRELTHAGHHGLFAPQFLIVVSSSGGSTNG